MKPRFRLLPLCLALACSAPSVTVDSAATIPDGWSYPTREPATTADSAMVVTDAALATDVGVQVLRSGGNAIDAAVAVAFALAVVYPEAGNIGGGGFLVVRAADGTEAALDFREKAPLAASRDMFLDSAGQPTDLSVTGHLAAGVPGAVRGLWEAHRRFGSRPWDELVAPAIRLARDGFPVNGRLARTVADDAARLGRFDASAALFLPGDEPIAEGSTWRNSDLAAVLERIALNGADGFYTGETADLIVAEMRRGGGLITHADLRAYEAKWRDPIVFDYRGHRVISMPPPSSGGLTLALIANIIEGFTPGADWRSTQSLHLLAEAMRRAFADRNQFLGDPDFADVPAARFLSESYAGRLRATIDSARATPSAEIRPGLDETAAVMSTSTAESDHTTHFSIVDALGNTVALTTTINELYGSAVTVAGAGFLLNDEMDDFTAKAGEPNMYGLVQGEANTIAPGKRMLSAMTPTIVLDSAGAVRLVTGARGGPRIITAVMQVLMNVVDHDMAPADAVHAPRIHHQHLPDALQYEAGGLLPDAVAALERMGHTVTSRDGVGNAPAIVRVQGRWAGVPDPRVDGKAAGY
jgi:gamma-glutamyltranspeptidase / glutathione hydrolase